MRDGKGKFFRGLDVDKDIKKLIRNYRKLKIVLDRETGETETFGQKVISGN